MPLNGGDLTPQRRRGAALEEALLDAAWDELVDKGYDTFTIESVAERAQTSRTVLYRRWATKPDLVKAAIAHGGFRDRVTAPDTGSFRSDLIALMKALNDVRAPIAVLLTARLGGYYLDTGTSLADLRSDLIDGRDGAVNVIDTLFDRAVERGEVDPGKLSRRARDLLFDLYRYEVLMTHRPVPDDVLFSIVDEVVVPLVRTTSVGGAVQPPEPDRPDDE